ncbi:MAG: hypothetical protein WCR54_08960 [Clostridia bacterium]
MSSSVSYELYNTKMTTGGSWFTPEGGSYETFINKTGANSIKGTIVVASTTTDNAVGIAPAETKMPIGVIYENGIADGSSVKVVTYGKADVLLKNGQAATNGYWCAVSDVNGRMYQESEPNTVEHYREIGHSLESKSSGTDVLARVQLHFN